MLSKSEDKTKCCEKHSEEKEKSGGCCQIEDQERAEALTYEQSFVTSERVATGLPEHKEKQ